ncbi:MAG: NAD(P)-dependent oxidoreductase [Saprospiraceae bacterium]|nr:NAD(P)-dependent oxidoreductase [Saprospiraceae bacterium]
MKKIIVTGAGGYVGVPLCEALLKKGYSVIALDRFFFGIDKMDAIKNDSNLEIRKDDLRYCDTGIFKEVYAVLDLAGLSNDASAEIDPALHRQSITRGGTVCKEAKENGVERFVYSSSASVWGGVKRMLCQKAMRCFRKQNTPEVKWPWKRF